MIRHTNTYRIYIMRVCSTLLTREWEAHGDVGQKSLGRMSHQRQRQCRRYTEHSAGWQCQPTVIGDPNQTLFPRMRLLAERLSHRILVCCQRCFDPPYVGSSKITSIVIIICRRHRSCPTKSDATAAVTAAAATAGAVIPLPFPTDDLWIDHR